MTNGYCLQRFRGVCVATSAALMFLASCASNNHATSDKRMFVSSKEFNQGRADGHRDAKASWTEDSAAWLWMWMKDNQYKKGYEQGWREGRTQIRFEAERSDAESLQE